MNISTLEEHLKRNVKIIVVGAGIAGLSAAERLFKRGFTNVEIFEASDRLGGRIRTQNFGDGYVEIGAQWLHGEKDNVAYQHAARRDLTLPSDYGGGGDDSSSDDEGDSPEEVFCTATDGVLSDQVSAYDAYDFLADKLENCPADDDHVSTTPTGSDGCEGQLHLQSFIEREFASQVTPGGAGGATTKTPNPDALVLRRAVLEWFSKFQCCVEGCDSLDQMSVDSFLEREACQGDMWINFRRGYRTLVSSVAEGIPREGVLRLRRAVKRIRLTAPSADKNDGDQDEPARATGSRAVLVECEDGTRHEADHVIVTVPLGYLKEHAREMFDPPLPDSKMKAIERMGFGTVDKIFLEFEEPVSAKGIEGYFLLWPQAETKDGRKLPEDDPFLSPSTPSAWWRHIHSIEPALFASNVLCWWISGAEARQVEALPDEEVKSACAELFRRFTGKEKLPPVKSITRSKWHEDPYTRGSFTYLTSELSSANKACRVLSDPIFAEVNGKQRPAILFAGEATHPYYFSSVHGAMETGRREAVRILASYATKRFTRLERLDSGGSF